MSWTYKNIRLGNGPSKFSQDLVRGFGFGADVDVHSDPLTTGTSQNYMLLLNNNQLLSTKEVTKWKKHMIYGLRPVINHISQDKKLSKIHHQKKHKKRLCSFQCNLSDIQDLPLKESIPELLNLCY